jgi:hypothetical protein
MTLRVATMSFWQNVPVVGVMLIQSGAEPLVASNPTTLGFW